MRVLLSGFEGFAEVTDNPSWEAAQAVCAKRKDAACVRLPVCYGTAGERLREAIARERPELVIALGVAMTRQKVTPEKLAINYRYAAIPDNAGFTAQGEAVCAGGPEAIFCSLPLEDWVRVLSGEGKPVALSVSAGSYVCNDLYYTLLRAQMEYGFKGLFVHVPDPGKVSAGEAAQIICRMAEMAL